ncbi:hypothetical protein BSKO_13023 [Bryopsis sp. KO-2023]|nr:hypothetical protein BSKO_13023 [Bryopsis sp. KO-2023]
MSLSGLNAYFARSPTLLGSFAWDPLCVSGVSSRDSVVANAGRRRGGDEGEASRRRANQPPRNSSKGRMFASSNRRKGRPAFKRNPDDTPLRDGNRDRLMGLLTMSAVSTLRYYLMETNVPIYHWLNAYIDANPIPRNGNWDDVSGEAFLRKMLSMPIQGANQVPGRDPMYDCSEGVGVDPRNLAQRIMEIRVHLAKEFIQELQAVSEENSILLRETLTLSLENTVDSMDEDKTSEKKSIENTTEKKKEEEEEKKKGGEKKEEEKND